MTQLRTFSRFTLHFFVRFRWRDNTGIHFGEGAIRDVSGKGLFIVTETLPLLHSVVRCWFYLPTREQLFFKHGYRVTTVARVLRISADVSSKDVGFAVFIRGIALKECEDHRKSGAFVNRSPMRKSN